jgi:hypothetical protein
MDSDSIKDICLHSNHDILIGICIHIIELSYIISKQSNKADIYYAILSFLVITCVYLMVSCIYLVILIINRRNESLFTKHQFKFIMYFFIIFSKLLNSSVAIV